MRTVTCINKEWTFIKEGDQPKIVNLPHTWNNKDGQDGSNDYYRGTCVYQKQFDYVIKPTNNRVFVEFNGVNSSCEVWLNDRLCKNHKGGYSTFRVDITDYLMEHNELKVIVNNEANQEVYPQRADFTFYGGIYRSVNLITTEENHFELETNGMPGIQVTPVIKEKKAETTIRTWVHGDVESVRVSIDGVGETLCYPTQDSNVFEGKILIPDVHLWDGIEDPYLYTARACLIWNGEVVDEITTKFGCRSYTFDPENGFQLNGRAYPLHGVSRHQDRKDQGNALTQKMHEEDINMILSMGANAVRLAHYQHDQYFYDLCDEKGLVVWAEIPYITVHMPGGRTNTLTQMEELIYQNYNHPSIICWTLSNEITLTGVTDDLIENHKILNTLVHRLDPMRVSCMANLFMLETDSPLLDIPDIRSYNLYYGWYVGELEDNDHFFDEFHKKYPEKVIGLSEYGADASVKIQTATPVKGDYSEQYQCIYHEHMLQMFAERPYLWSTFVWNMFDFGSDGRDEANDPGINHKGLVSFDRKIKKDAFYIYKAWWSKEPFVHICGRRYYHRAEPVTQIKIYTNQLKVSLYIDEKLFETKNVNHVVTFDVPINGHHIIKAVVENEASMVPSITDVIEIQKTQEPDPTYQLQDHDVNNWFNQDSIKVSPGYYSINDTLGDIKKSPAGAALVEAVMEKATKAMGNMAQNVQITDQMVQMMNRMPLKKLLLQGGQSVSQEMLISVNDQLSKIKKQ